jgi:hypothetical protein
VNAPYALPGAASWPATVGGTSSTAPQHRWRRQPRAAYSKDWGRPALRHHGALTRRRRRRRRTSCSERWRCRRLMLDRSWRVWTMSCTVTYCPSQTLGEAAGTELSQPPPLAGVSHRSAGCGEVRCGEVWCGAVQCRMITGEERKIISFCRCSSEDRTRSCCLLYT